VSPGTGSVIVVVKPWDGLAVAVEGDRLLAGRAAQLGFVFGLEAGKPDDIVLRVAGVFFGRR